ncbi:MaoC family dehydratase N-terminal domain-containing protein [Neobacillus drentensis]|uniref:MaoC family dehydratase N-terminal domain-containing protein n=1 Tax=Neobacillus drentensis TaxID=220684 RepID=UPI0008240D04|nr:MaoC family dehydratase N-terminal domain-containing protein [Neobacillus drentensis]
MIDRSLIGKVNEPVYLDIEKGAIRKFARAIGDDNPVYHDEAAAKAKGYPSLLAPLTFPTTFREIEPEWYTKIDKSTLLHGEQEYEYFRRFYAGERIKCIEKVIDVFEKTGRNGKLTFIVRDKEGFDGAEELIFRERQTLVVRG